MRIKQIRLIAVFLAAACILSACGGGSEKTGAAKLSFKDALSFDYLQSLDGKPVTINGYLATSSPVDGSFIFLMNMPYQSCPFCIPNTSQLSNTIEVYPKKGQSFSYTNQAVKVTGTLEVAPEGETFSDTYGYEFSFKIVDGSFSVLQDEDMTEDMKLWQKFAATDLIDRLNQMYEYVNFVCAWNTYSVNSYVDDQGNTQPGYYLYPGDAKQLLNSEDGQYYYGTVDGYFDDLIADIRAVDATAFEDLVKNVEDARTLADEAMTALVNGEYTAEEQYIEKFDTTDFVYTLNQGEEYQSRMEELFYTFSTWLGGWEL